MKALLDPESSFSQNPRLSSSDTLVVGALPFMQEWMAHKESSVQSLDGLISKTRSKINTQKQHEREKGLQGRIQSFSSFRAACNEQVSGFFEAEKEESFSSNSPSKHQISSIFDSLGEDAEIPYQIGDYEKAEFSKREEDFHSSLAAVSDAQEKLLTSANLFEALVNSVAIYTASQQFESAQVQLTLATPIHSLISGAQKVHTTYGPTRITAEEFQAAGYPVTSFCLSDPFVAFDHFTHAEILSSMIPVNVKQSILTGGSISLGFGGLSYARPISSISKVPLYDASARKIGRISRNFEAFSERMSGRFGLNRHGKSFLLGAEDFSSSIGKRPLHFDRELGRFESMLASRVREEVIASEASNLDRFNKAPYHPQKMRHFLEEQYGDSVKAHTMAVEGDPNFALAMSDKAHPVTGVYFDTRIFPVFEKQVI